MARTIKAVPNQEHPAFEDDGDNSFEVVPDPDMPDYEDNEIPQSAMDIHPSNYKPEEKESVTVAETNGSPTIKVVTTFSRTRQVGQFEPARMEVTIEESFPGTMTPQEVAELVGSQAQLVKAEVFQELGIDFSQDEATGRIMEAFPGTRVVASRSTPEPPATAPVPVEVEDQAPPRAAQSAPKRPQGAGGSTGQGRTQQASRGRQSAPIPNRQQLWQELCDFPGLWNDNRNDKGGNAKRPDFRSTKWKNDAGYPIGLWLTDKEAPEEDDIPEDGFANYEQ